MVEAAAEAAEVVVEVEVEAVVEVDVKLSLELTAAVEVVGETARSLWRWRPLSESLPSSLSFRSTPPPPPLSRVLCAGRR